MVITEISEWHKGTYLIYLNDEPSFALYGKEIGEYGLKEGEELSDEAYRRILDEVLIKRTKSRTLHILDKNDKTEKELRDKLKENMYPAEAIDAAVEAAKKGNYLNDRRYAAEYINSKLKRHSLKRIEADLKHKGIDCDIIDESFSDLKEQEDENDTDREADLIYSLIKKRVKDTADLSPEEEAKLFRYLTGKGFEYAKVKIILDRYLQEQSDMV